MPAILNQVSEVELSEIFVDPIFNCRGQIAAIDVAELCRSIESIGLQQPIIIQPYALDGYKYRVVMGHRRYEAFKLLKRSTIPAILRNHLSETESVVANLIENLERKNLTFMQEARALTKFKGMAVRRVADMINQSTGWVSIRINALKLPEDIQREIDIGAFTQEQVKHICSLPIEKQYITVGNIKDAQLKREKFEIPAKSKKLTKALKPPIRVRSTSDMFRLMDVLFEAIGPGLHTRVLAWCAAQISDRDLLLDIAKVCEDAGKTFDINTSLYPEHESSHEK